MRPRYFTKKQSELLQLIYPAPIGKGLTQKEACDVLGITAWLEISLFRFIAVNAELV